RLHRAISETSYFRNEGGNGAPRRPWLSALSVARPLGASLNLLATARSFGSHSREGFLAGGPLLLPGSPLIFDGSCIRVVGFSWFVVELEPTVSPGLTEGPLLFPG